MPDGALNYRSIPLPKPSSDMNANYADPSKLYRFLAMAPLLTKILGLALDARFIHWATKYNHIDTSFQGASMPYLDTEHLPLHFMECIKAMWEKKLSVASIFVDLRKAYDMVHPDLMSTISPAWESPPTSSNSCTTGIPAGLLSFTSMVLPPSLSQLKGGWVRGMCSAPFSFACLWHP